MTIVALALLLVAACGGGVDTGGPGPTAAPTTVGGDQPVDSGDGDEPITDPLPPGEIPEPRPPIDGSIDGEVTIAMADLRIAESYPIQVSLWVEGDKPTPCHEVFWTVDDDGETISIQMISQIAADQQCTQVIEPFMISVPLGSWAGESRSVELNGEVVGSFDS